MQRPWHDGGRGRAGRDGAAAAGGVAAARHGVSARGTAGLAAGLSLARVRGGGSHLGGHKCGLLLVSVGIITHRILYVFYCIHCIHVQYIQCVYIVLHYMSFSVALILMYSCSGCIQMYSWTCGATLECHTAFMCIRSLCCIRITFSTSHIKHIQ